MNLLEINPSKAIAVKSADGTKVRGIADVRQKLADNPSAIGSINPIAQYHATVAELEAQLDRQQHVANEAKKRLNEISQNKTITIEPLGCKETRLKEAKATLQQSLANLDVAMERESNKQNVTKEIEKITETVTTTRSDITKITDDVLQRETAISRAQNEIAGCEVITNVCEAKQPRVAELQHQIAVLSEELQSLLSDDANYQKMKAMATQWATAIIEHKRRIRELYAKKDATEHTQQAAEVQIEALQRKMDAMPDGDVAGATECVERAKHMVALVAADVENEKQQNEVNRLRFLLHTSEQLLTDEFHKARMATVSRLIPVDGIDTLTEEERNLVDEITQDDGFYYIMETTHA